MTAHYDDASEKYLESNERVGFLTSSQDYAYDQILEAFPDRHATISVMELGTGPAAFLERLHRHYPHARLTGLDTSQRMLDLAKQRLPQLTAIHASITEEKLPLEPATFDVVIVHFVCAYVALDEVLKVCARLLKPGGVVSICTTTRQNFPRMQEVGRAFAGSSNPIKRLLFRLNRSEISDCRVPQSGADIVQTGARAGFDVQAHDENRVDLVFEGTGQAFHFLYYGGWLAGSSPKRILPQWLVKVSLWATIFACLRFLGVPFKDQVISEVVLLRKRGGKA